MTAEHGPYETGQQARETPAVQAVYAAFDADPGAGKMRQHNLAMLTSACEDAGVELGEFDRQRLAGIANWEPVTCVVIAGIIRRAAGTVLGYSLATRYPDGAVRMDPLGSVFTDPAQAVEQRDVAQGHSAARGWDERWVAVRLTEVPETAKGDSSDG